MDQEVTPTLKTMKMFRSIRLSVMRVKRLSGKRSERVRVHKDPPRGMKLWQFKLPLLLLLCLHLKHLSLGMRVTSLGAISAVIIILLPAHAEKSFAKTVARRVTSREVAERQPN